MKNGVVILLAVTIMSTAAAVIFAPAENLQFMLDQVIQPACLFVGKVFVAIVIIIGTLFFLYGGRH